MSSFKHSILSACKQVIHYKITLLNDALTELSESANVESKSSAGDKHETGRAMVHLEQEKLGKQLQEWQNQNALIERIDANKQITSIALGTLIETNRGFFFIASNLGKLEVDERDIICISLQSPLGEQFTKMKEGDAFEFNKTQYQIIKLS
jgi:hypothetical protein